MLNGREKNKLRSFKKGFIKSAQWNEHKFLRRNHASIWICAFCIIKQMPGNLIRQCSLCRRELWRQVWMMGTYRRCDGWPDDTLIRIAIVGRTKKRKTSKGESRIECLESECQQMRIVGPSHMCHSVITRRFVP